MEQLPTRLELFGGVAWRAWLITIVGGFVVGAVAGLGFLLFDDETDVVVIPGTGLLGAGFGLVFGFLPAAVVAGFVAVIAVPPRTPQRILELTRWVATGIVTTFVAWLTTLFGSWAVQTVTLMATVAGAWFATPYALRWYMGRLDASTR